jgi:2-oxoglutarate ferredoxin oxidoreductase subunit beta
MTSGDRERPAGAEVVYERPEALTDVVTHYCPGCTHGIAHRLVAEVIDELGVRERTVGIAPVGCSVLAYNYFAVDMQQAAHGRAPAVATGIKRVHPDCVVFTYQGDGDLAAIGTSEIIHAAMRGERLTVIFINNAIFGMTGGQMAPTTLIGQETTTSPKPTGRLPERAGYPIRICEMLSQLDGAAYVARASLSSPSNIVRAKKAVRKAFEAQLGGHGLGIVELLASCNVNWKMTPADALKWIDSHMVPVFPLGVFKDWAEAGAEAARLPAARGPGRSEDDAARAEVAG